MKRDAKEAKASPPPAPSLREGFRPEHVLSAFWCSEIDRLQLPAERGGEGLHREVAYAIVLHRRLRDAVFAAEKITNQRLRDWTLIEKVLAVRDVMGLPGYTPVAAARCCLLETLYIAINPDTGARTNRLAVSDPADALNLVQAEIAVGIRNWHGVLDIKRLWRAMSRGVTCPDGRAFEGREAEEMLLELVAGGERGVLE